MNGVEWNKYFSETSAAQFIRDYGYDPSGCENCDWGIAAQPAGLDAVKAPEYMKRAIAAAHGAIVFCDCPAGKSAYRTVESTLAKMPAGQIDGRSTSIPLKEAGKGRYIWSTGHCPIGYVPQTIVTAVLNAINEQPQPTFHTREEPKVEVYDDEDIF